MEQAWPTQVVAIGAATNCIVSYRPSIEVNEPPGELM